MYFYAWQLLSSEIRLIFLGGPLPSNTRNRLSICHFSGCTFSPMDFHKYKYYLISLLNPICVHWTFHLWVFFAVDVVVAVIIFFVLLDFILHQLLVVYSGCCCCDCWLFFVSPPSQSGKRLVLILFNEFPGISAFVLHCSKPCLFNRSKTFQRSKPKQNY